MISHRGKSVAFMLFAVVFSAAAMAESSYWYIGGSMGTAWASGLDDLTADDVAQAFEETGIRPSRSPSIISTSNSSTSFSDYDDIDWKLHAGYQFNKYLGVEAQYTQLGDFERSARLSGAVALFAPAGLVEETEVEGYGLSLVGTYPVSQGFAVVAKAGAFFWETDTSGDLGVQTGTRCVFVLCAPIAREASYSIDDSGTDPMFGLGVVFSGSGGAIRLEWEHYMGIGHGFDSETDMELFTLGLEYRFGGAQ